MDITYYKKYEPVFGSWKIVREIGEGSFGKVFEIEREDFGRTYKSALKAVTIPQSQSEIKSAMADGMDQESVTTYFRGFVEEIVDEFAIMSQLKGHSNVVSYRYCDRSQVPTYHFQRWGSWSSWTTQPAASSATKQVESSTFYRYRDKVDKPTYIFYRWTDWSDWSETPIEETDDNEVETQIMYRYKSK